MFGMRLIRRKAFLFFIFFLQMASAYGEPQGLFVQVSSLPIGNKVGITRSWFDAVCDKNRSGVGKERIQRLVLQQAADNDGKLYNPQLDVVEDYFQCFDEIYFGTAHKQWNGSGSQYIDGIVNDEFRQENIDLSNQVAEMIVERYKGLNFHWYINYEANLNFLAAKNLNGRGIDGGHIIAAYQDYLGKVARHMLSLRNGKVLWSPTFWSKAGSLDSGKKKNLQNAISRLLAGVPELSALHFQDFFGQSSFVKCHNNNCEAAVYRSLTCQDTVEYFFLLKNAAIYSGVKDIAVNIEMFTMKKNKSGKIIGIIEGSTHELSEREACYRSKQVPVGVSWEIRWWYLSHHANSSKVKEAPIKKNSTDPRSGVH